MNARTLALFAALALLAQACIYVDEPYHDPYVHDLEPNDVYWQAQGIGPISVGEEIQVRGHIEDLGSDRYDGFAFQSTSPMDIVFELYADDPYDDFDLELFDPYTLTTVASWESPSNPETGRFSVTSSGFEFHLVVSSFRGSGAYTLRVRGAPLSWPGDGPNGLAAQAHQRAERGIDWRGYAAPRGNDEADAPAPAPELRILHFAIDPQTGRVRKLGVQRLPIQALAATE